MLELTELWEERMEKQNLSKYQALVEECRNMRFSKPVGVETI